MVHTWWVVLVVCLLPRPTGERYYCYYLVLDVTDTLFGTKYSLLFGLVLFSPKSLQHSCPEFSITTALSVIVMISTPNSTLFRRYRYKVNSNPLLFQMGLVQRLRRRWQKSWPIRVVGLLYQSTLKAQSTPHSRRYLGTR